MPSGTPPSRTSLRVSLAAAPPGGGTDRGVFRDLAWLENPLPPGIAWLERIRASLVRRLGLLSELIEIDSMHSTLRDQRWIGSILIASRHDRSLALAVGESHFLEEEAVLVPLTDDDYKVHRHQGRRPTAHMVD